MNTISDGIESGVSITADSKEIIIAPIYSALIIILVNVLIVSETLLNPFQFILMKFSNKRLLVLLKSPRFIINNIATIIAMNVSVVVFINDSGLSCVILQSRIQFKDLPTYRSVR